MSETLQKYEILILLPLTATNDELMMKAGEIEERLRSAGAKVVGSAPFIKGRLAYPINKMNQGYYHLIQFEMNPGAVAEFRQMLLLSGEVVRFNIAKVEEFKPFMPLDPQVIEKRALRASRDTATMATFSARPPEMVVDVIEKISQPLPAANLVQEKVEPAQSQKQPKVSMEELNKRLEEILGE